MKCILVKTDGYEIEHANYDTIEEAQEAMRKEYEDCTPVNNDDECAETSSIDDMNAILYANCENVYVWKIIPIEIS